jgi:acetylornithine/N-succinyldiaminopimelate aminotransferase
MAFLGDKTKNLYRDNHFDMYRRFPLTIISGEGCTVHDDEGKAYLDALAGIAVNVVGHSHPNVVQAIREQAGRLIHVSNLYYNVPQSSLAALLTEMSGMDRVFFCNSGLEANEGALKIVRKHGMQHGKSGPVVSFEGCFHGRSIATLGLGQKKYQEGFGPMPEGFLQLPFNDLDALDTIPQEAVAIFIECVQGEGGIRPVSRAFADKISHICEKHNILLVADEIQSGLGRTGKLFAYHHYGLQPDIVTLAKGLGSGVPIGAVLAREETAAVISPGDHGTTFGGNPLATAAALATLKTILEEDLVNAAREKGHYLHSRLNILMSEYSLVREIRGLGLMIGIELVEPCRPIALHLMEKGLLVSCTADKTLRIVPPLTISYDEMDMLLEKIGVVLQEHQKEASGKAEM